MSALPKESQPKELHIAEDINLVVDFTKKPNRTNLKAYEDRAVVAKLRADLILPNDHILTVDINFDTISGYHNNAILVMDDFGAEIVATAFEKMYGQEYGEKVRKTWMEKPKDDPRKPTYLFVQKPDNESKMAKVFAACTRSRHEEAPANPTDYLAK